MVDAGGGSPPGAGVTMFKISLETCSMSRTMALMRADQIIVAGVAGNGHRQPRRGADERLPDAVGKLADMSTQAGVLKARGTPS